jgi:hypothetical protein
VTGAYIQAKMETNKKQTELEERIIMPCISKTCHGTKTRFEYIGSEGAFAFNMRHVYQCSICEQQLKKYKNGEIRYSK